MNYKIVADSSSNILSMEGVDYASVPMKLVTDVKEYVDDAYLDTAVMLSELEAYKGRSGSACPNVGEWLEAFGQAEGVFTVSITSTLSGCYNASVQAKAEYEESHPGRKVCCLDTLSAGPEPALVIEKLRQLISEGMQFEEIVHRIREYMNHTHLLFMLESVDNLAKNGRVSSLIARAVGVLGIRIVGKASDEGTLEQLHKCRGEKRGIRTLLRELEEQGYKGGKVRIAHSFNNVAAMEISDCIKEQYPDADISVIPVRGLCTFYAERGGLLVGFEDSKA